MAVLLTVSETINGAAVSDGLAGGGTGVDMGSVVTGSYAPVTDKNANTGAKHLYIRHDAVVDPITDVKMFIQTFGTGTGFTYGGADSAANDYARMKTLADSSGDSKNNADGLSGGLWADFDADASTAAQFDFATNGRDGATTNGNGTVVKFGDRTSDGIDLNSAFVINADAMVYDAPGETVASAPQAGKIGKAGDTALGDNAHVKLRIYLPSSFTTGGIQQWETVIAYSFTA